MPRVLCGTRGAVSVEREDGKLGIIHSDSDEGDGSIKYTISGEGAGTIFIIDEVTGDIHATERLDREEKTFYTLRAQARDRLTDAPLEPESEFVIKVQDINDSEPKFLEGPYIGSVAELSPIGKSYLFHIGCSRSLLIDTQEREREKYERVLHSLSWTERALMVLLLESQEEVAALMFMAFSVPLKPSRICLHIIHTL
ncbi:Cadherin-22 [Labeo rohita]|uniref:Cadherin-22 n=1 Tax=Labeo rohita TaxID=84645 RepID=A0ABQ8MM70_LABRO|nr:Cadherin-22 [Labeo rohita]